MKPQELEAQSPIKIDRWVDVHSSDCKEIDGDLHAFTLKCIKIGFEDGAMFVDNLGRIWCKWKSEGPCFPFHTEFGKQFIGYRLASKAAN